MITEPLIVIAILIIAYGAFSKKLSSGYFSAPMVFMAAGLASGSGGLKVVDIHVDNHVLEGFAEITLGLILFADATSTNSRRLFKENGIPARLLLVALPLTIALGAVVAIVVFPDLSWQQCVLIAAILAPTDAALGYAVVTSKIVPERIRQSILVESGLNDGLALPVVLLFAALSFSVMGEQTRSLDYWLLFALQQIVVGVVVGGWSWVFAWKIYPFCRRQRMDRT